MLCNSSWKIAKYFLNGLYVGIYIFLNGLVGFTLEDMSVDILKLRTCMFSIDKGSGETGKILKCAHSGHCGYCSFLCLAVVEKCIKIMLYEKANELIIN